MSSEMAIEVENLSKCYHVYSQPRDRLKQMVYPRVKRIFGMQSAQYYQEFWALKDISFEVNRGETFGIIGRNGSGKSTLLQMICGTLNPTSGSVKNNGRIAALLELGAGFNPEFTGRENVYMNATVLGLSIDEIDARYDAIAAFADIGEFIERPVKTYSSGMYVRLAFAVAINVEPQILIVDEALAVGDEPFQRKCYSKIERIRDSGATILLVTHAAATVTQMCSRAMILDYGSQLFVGDPKLAVESYYRLLYASSSEAEKIKKELRSQNLLLQQQIDVDHSKLILPEGQPIRVEGSADSVHSSDRFTSERYDPELRPLSTMDYESQGARISNVHIENKLEQYVNVLLPGEEYCYCYEVFFDKEAHGVHFGMLIKTTTGNDLGAIGSHSYNKSIHTVNAGERYLVRFPFTNVFSPGTYFMNAGCNGSINGGEQFLHRVIDIIAFRVEHTAMQLRYAGPIQISAAEPSVILAPPVNSDLSGMV